MRGAWCVVRGAAQVCAATEPGADLKGGASGSLAIVWPRPRLEPLRHVSRMSVCPCPSVSVRVRQCLSVCPCPTVVVRIRVV